MSTINNIFKARLLKLGNHLLTGTLGHERFDFCVWNAGKKKENGCGTSGCAIGECPIVFPESWIFARTSAFGHQVPALLEVVEDEQNHGQILTSVSSILRSACEFFDLSGAEASYLFVPDTFSNSRPLVLGKRRSLHGTEATREQVGARIIKFAEEKWPTQFDAHAPTTLAAGHGRTV